MWSRLFSMFKDPHAAPDDINLLLLGETGVGKSTFINSISNYFNYYNFKKAQKGKIEVLIPVCLNFQNSNKVCGNPDENESHESGKSATQHVKVYLFPIKMDGKTFNLRLVDTPGVGDPRGMEQDNVNLDNILAYLATLKKLHAICFIMKSNQTRFTKFVEYCLKQILTRLDKSASQNIMFVTTYSKTAQYTAGETKVHCLEPLVRDIQSRPPNVSIPLSDKNIFAVDNEAFKALLEMQEGKTFTKHELAGLDISWQISSKEIRRLLTYIIGDAKTPALKPHDVENTISVNEVRFLVEQLATPIAEVSELVQDNLRLLERHKRNLSLENQTLDELKNQLYIPCIDLEIKELSQPVTVCTDSKCAEIIKVNDVTQWHYKQRCHNPCYLSGIPKEMIGDPGIIHCAAMSGDTCQRCSCNWKVHMHIYKETEKKEVQKVDENVKTAIKTKEDARVGIETLMKELNKRMKELEKEGETISESIAKFSYFLQEHALTPYNDAYSDYIQQLIKNEQHLGKFGDKDVIDKLQKLLNKHEHLQKTFEQSAQKYESESAYFDLSPQGIKKCIADLYELKHMGPKIEELIQKSTASRHKETQKNFNCVVSKQIVLEEKKSKAKKQRNDVEESNYLEQDGVQVHYEQYAQSEQSCNSDSEESGSTARSGRSSRRYSEGSDHSQGGRSPARSTGSGCSDSDEKRSQHSKNGAKGRAGAEKVELTKRSGAKGKKSVGRKNLEEEPEKTKSRYGEKEKASKQRSKEEDKSSRANRGKGKADGNGQSKSTSNGKKSKFEGTGSNGTYKRREMEARDVSENSDASFNSSDEDSGNCYSDDHGHRRGETEK